MSVNLTTILTCIGLLLTVMGMIGGAAALVLKGAFRVSSTLTALVEQVKQLTNTVSDGFRVAEERTSEARAEAETKIVRAHEKIDTMGVRMNEKIDALSERHNELEKRVAVLDGHCKDRTKNGTSC